ncbi:2,3-diaminopropionate biosynthesis protein SbnA [Kitasatospora sp. CM 4170]|uniref:N-(2-amino-2-carboxyethyl)-L-glutamate synthase n=1 Tax=Kitasatospora aburaviensis TaxID=67265 RepID=A0ABW1F790_9ACTN|nr:2,3-diaminopropionate biosynthesis protein SbnA [Kitasatospora sp. CM 4170]WNM49137.1 2,3-diaminopropionate biosynthesis protein SbnA [Kitasatospora sp. CM 4170]
MTIISTADELFDGDLCIDLRRTLGIPLYLKCEGFNFTGSIKIRAAVSMVSAGIQQGLITRDSTIVESSSGNLGVALSVVAAARSLRFVCVTDPKCNPATVKLMCALGTRVVVAETPDAAGSHLSARKELVRELCRRNAGYVWLNQYENPANWIAHYETTAPLIAKQFPELHVLFVGTGTGGTLTGCSRYFRENRPDVRVVAVDTVGSVNFGMPAGPRHLPGVGAGERMPLLDAAPVHDLVQVPEQDTVRTCRCLARQGFLLGGSTGTVVSGAARWLARHDPAGTRTSVAVSADTGERYLDTVYDDSWVRRTYGALAGLDALDPPEWLAPPDGPDGLDRLDGLGEPTEDGGDRP